VRYNECMSRWVILASLVLTALTTGVAAAQQVTITAPPPPKERSVEGLIGPKLQYEITQPDDARYLPPGPRVHQEPAFIEPMSVATETPTSTGRMGFAGWTAPSAAMGGLVSGIREVTGYFALGFAVEWGGPPPMKRPVR
jgi:hypothetical protein